MSTDKLLEKIQKLLAMSTSSNPHEAAIFLEKATALMEEHNLTDKDVKRAQLGFVLIKSTQSVSKVKDWESDLVRMVCAAFGCKHTWIAGDSKYVDYWGRFRVLGEKDKVLLAEYAIVFLLRQLVKERTEFSRKLSAQGYRRSPAMTRELDGFCKGWIKIVRAKVHAFANDAELQALIDDYLLEFTNGNKVKRHSRGNGYWGNLHGQEAAANVHLHRPMNQEEVLKLS